jgi:hypothetical protein
MRLARSASLSLSYRHVPTHTDTYRASARCLSRGVLSSLGARSLDVPVSSLRRSGSAPGHRLLGEARVASGSRVETLDPDGGQINCSYVLPSRCPGGSPC